MALDVKAHKSRGLPCLHISVNQIIQAIAINRE